jgi:hypothetical protein
MPPGQNCRPGLEEHDATRVCRRRQRVHTVQYMIQLYDSSIQSVVVSIIVSKGR